MKLTDRFRSRELVRTNDRGAETTFAVGNRVTFNHLPGVWRVTRHEWVPTVPWHTVIVYGKKVK